MATPNDSTQDKNTYFIDTESSAEMARLLNQDRIITKAMGGLLAEQSEETVDRIRRVLDVGCGPGAGYRRWLSPIQISKWWVSTSASR